jgi:hypothetical protein
VKLWQPLVSQYPDQYPFGQPDLGKNMLREMIRISKKLNSSTFNGKKLTSIRFLSTVSLFKVSVPVLSLQRTSMPAISSIAVILFVIAPYNARNNYTQVPQQITLATIKQTNT